VAVLTMPAEASSGYGRIDREDGRVTRIVERKDEPSCRTEPFEANSGMMAIDARWALPRLQSLKPSPTTGEWYLTDLVEIAASEGGPERGWPVVTVSGDESYLMGVNDRVELAEAEQRLLRRIRREQMLAGVTIRQPESVTIEQGVSIGRDTVIEPGSIIRAGTTIGERCTIGPYAMLDGARIGNDVRVNASTIEHASIGDGSDVGPYAHLRKGAEIGAGVHIGNYAEIKNTRIATGVRVGHFSYLGDATIGVNTNIGAGTVTANYDGARKNLTTIGENVFIGSDTMLVAPVEIGDGARTAAGSVVTRDVPPGQLVMGVPARPKQPAQTGAEESGEQNG
jgi:bifunctional UDP-N-acetylglucosamine pyrophosphorylase/glucosamine-1-phosphate N-acetyltransferase